MPSGNSVLKGKTGWSWAWDLAVSTGGGGQGCNISRELSNHDAL